MFIKRYSRPGTAPATLTPLVHPEHAHPPKLRVVEYDEDSIVEREVHSVADLPHRINDGKIRWIEMNGLSNVEMLKELGEKYGLHPLALEDVLNVGQRPKLEAYNDHLFMIAQMIYRDDADRLCGEQVSVFLWQNMLISIQEEDNMDVFPPVRERLRTGRGFIRKMKADYLAYALIDAVVDHCFPVLEEIGEALEEIEETLMGRPDKNVIHQLHGFKRTLMQLRRFVWPERDVVNSLLHSEHAVVAADTKVFLRDCYDHTVQIMDLIESYRDVTSGLLEMYLSSVSFRTNEIMRLLTVISSIFIPLTFIVGVYGMNFHREGANGKEMFWNMPELYSPYGYVGVMTFMLLISVGQIVYFKRKKWL